MKALVLSAYYLDAHGGHDRMYVHLRGWYYLKYGIDATVINFDTARNYIRIC